MTVVLYDTSFVGTNFAMNSLCRLSFFPLMMHAHEHPSFSLHGHHQDECSEKKYTTKFNTRLIISYFIRSAEPIHSIDQQRPTYNQSIVMSENALDVSSNLQQRPPQIPDPSGVKNITSPSDAFTIMSVGREASTNAVDRVSNHGMHAPPPPPPSYAMGNNFYEIPQFGLPSLPSRSSSTAQFMNNTNTTNTGQYVNMSDLFTFLRTAESEGRLSPDKCSRLRHVLMGAESSAVNGGGCCWMDVVFKVLCELIPAPVYPRVATGAVGNGSTRVNEDTFTLASRQQHEPQNWSVGRGNSSSRQSVTNDEASMRDASIEPSVLNPTDTTVDSGSAVPTSKGATCQPCQAPEMKPARTSDESNHENDDAVAALLDMKMNPSPTNNNTNKRKASSTLSPSSSEPPAKIPAAIYPHPFSYIKDPKLYRRTRCKVPNCPNNGGACQDHGHDIKICRIHDCTNRAVKSGVCSKHGAKRPLCRVEGCTNQSKREGRCIKHGAVYGNCSEEGCVNLARSGGLCRKHGAK